MKEKAFRRTAYGIAFSILEVMVAIAAILTFVFTVVLNKPNAEVVQYRDQYWPAPKRAAVHDGTLHIQVMDRATQKPMELFQVFVLCAKGEKRVEANCNRMVNIPIGNCDDTEINARLCNSERWLSDKPQYVPGRHPLVQDQFTILVNDVELDASNTGRSGKSHNYFLNLKRK